MTPSVETHERGKGWVRAQEESHRGFEVRYIYSLKKQIELC